MSASPKTIKGTLAIAYKSNFISLVKMTDLLQTQQISQTPIGVTYMDQGYHIGRLLDDIDPSRSNPSTIDMDIAIHRPLLITSCSTDSTIRIWNYLTLQCEMVKCLTLQQPGKAVEPVPPLSIAFHPSGYLVAAGFKSQAIIWHVLEDDLRPLFVFQHYKHCTKVRFSHGGQYLAIAQMFVTHKCVYVHSTYSMKKLFTIKIPSNALVCDLVFSKDDLYIALCCTEGFINVFNIQTQAEVHTHTCMKCVYSTCFIDGPREVTAFGADETKKGFIRKIVDEEIKQSFNTNLPTRVASASFLSPNHLIVGTENGLVKLLEYPLNGKDYMELNMHVGAVGKIIVAPSGRQAFSCGEDGCLFVYTVQTEGEPGPICENKMDQAGTLSVIGTLASIVLVEKDKLKRDQKTKEKLIAKVEDLERERKAVEDTMSSQHQKQIESLESNKRKSLAELEKRLGEIKDELIRREKYYADTIKKAEANRTASVADLGTVFKSKLDHERKMYMSQEQSLRDSITSLQNALEKKEKGKEKELIHDHEVYEKELERLGKKLKEVRDTQNATERKFDDKIEIQEEEQELEKKIREEQLMKEISAKKEAIKSKDEDLNRMENKIKELSDAKTDLYHNNQALKVKQAELEIQKKSLKEEVERAQKERTSSQEDAKELKNKLYKNKTKHKKGVKDKQVLAEMSKKLKEKLVPVTKDNNILKSKITQIEEEYREDAEIMEQQAIAEKKLKDLIEQNRIQISKKDQKYKELSDYYKEITNTVFLCRQKNDANRAAYNQLFTDLYTKYVTKLEDTFVMNSEVADELTIQKELILKKSASQTSLRNQEKIHYEGACRALRAENSRVLKELKETAKKLKELNTLVENLESKLKRIENQESEEKKKTIGKIKLTKIRDAKTMDDSPDPNKSNLILKEFFNREYGKII